MLNPVTHPGLWFVYVPAAIALCAIIHIHVTEARADRRKVDCYREPERWWMWRR